MSVSIEQHRFLYKIAHAYYLDGLTQLQIAKRMGLSRPKVSRLLQKAKKEKVVSITLVPPPGGMVRLEHELEQKFGLEEVIIVPVSDTHSPAGVTRELGPAAAELLVRCMSGKEVVGITWGTTMTAMIDALPHKYWPEVTIVQICGGLGPVGSLEHSTEIARRMAQKFSSMLSLLPVPGIVSNKEAALALKSDRLISQTLKIAANADIAVFGMGVPATESVLVQSGTIITQKDLKILKQANVAGDISLQFIDRDGRMLDLEINDHVVGLTLEQIKKIPRIIAVAGGDMKYEVIRGAMVSKIPHALVTDHVTAKKLLDENIE